MTDLAAQATSVRSRSRWRAGRQLRDGSTLAWWRELVLVGALYLAYATARNLSSSTPERAFDNAMLIIDWQRAVNLWHELGLQEWALQHHAMVVVANYFYGSAYIIVTVLGLVFLYRVHPNDYPLWRNTLAIGTLLGLIGFATFPLMPPRLLDELGSGQTYGFVDTLVSYPTFWSFDSPAMQAVSNQFAAMPSLHCGWAFWSMWVFYPRVSSWWGKSLAVAYPVATIYVVVITANHYLLDAVGGLLVFAIAYVIARRFTRAGRRDPVPTPETSPASP